MRTCTTCTRPENAPYRRVVDGAIIEGCVDACHSWHLREGTADYAWHNRTDAVALRTGIYTGRKRALSPQLEAEVRRQNRIEQARAHVAEHARTARYWVKDARRGFARGDAEGGLRSLEIAGQDREIARGWRAELARLEAA